MKSEFPVYPIYDVRFNWPQEGEHFRDGRNSSLAAIMLKKPSATDLAAKCLAIQENIAEENNLGPCDVAVKIRKVRFEEWCCGWFSHWTFDIGLSDREILDSFQRYVWRIQEHNRKTNYFFIGPDGEHFYTDDVCLMGAEDRWRWTARAGGTSMIGCGNQTGEAPCRCEGCRKQGIVRIDH